MRSALVPVVLLAWPTAAHAARSDAIRKLLEDHKDEVAREKCGKWQAAEATDDKELREACAKAFWPVAEREDTAVAWRAYRETWAGTGWAETALVREAAAALRSVGSRAPEADLLELADRYRGTPSEEGFRKRAAEAAIRDASTVEEAHGAASRYPHHPDLWNLVERFPEGFLDVAVKGREVSVTVDSLVDPPEGAEPEVSWVARRPSGDPEPWDDFARRYLLDQGVAKGWLDAWEAARAEPPRYPLCAVSGQPPGFGPGVRVSLAGATLVEPVDWDEGCGPDAWPVFLTVAGGRVVSISVRPGHRLDLDAGPPANGRDVRSFLPKPAGTPVLLDGAVYVPAGPVWLGRGLGGGQPWATGRDPGDRGQPLGGLLKSVGLSADWQLVPAGDELEVKAPVLDKMPPAMRTWRIRRGEVREIAPLTWRVLGLDPAALGDRSRVAPELGPAAGWVRNPDGSVQRLPPTGAKVAGIYQMEPGDLAVAADILAGAGLSRERAELLDGWKADLDRDRVPEMFVRAVVDGEGMLLVVDPYEKSGAASIRDARVFALDEPGVRSDRRVSETPWTFRKGDFVYLAWAGSEVTGPTSRRRFLVVVRTDGEGYATSRFDL